MPKKQNSPKRQSKPVNKYDPTALKSTVREVSKQQEGLAQGLQTFADLNILERIQNQKLEQLEMVEKELHDIQDRKEQAEEIRKNTDFTELLNKYDGKRIDNLPEQLREIHNSLPDNSENRAEFTENVQTNTYSDVPGTSPRLSGVFSPTFSPEPAEEVKRKSSAVPDSFKSAFGRNTSSIYMVEEGQVCPHCKYGILESCLSEAGTSCEFFVYCPNCNAYVCTYKPMPHQTIFHIDEHSFKLYAGGFGSAKTYTCGMEFIANVLQIAGSQGLVGAATWSQCEDTCLKFILENIPQKLIASTKKDKVSWRMQLVNGSTIFAKALNEEGKIRSANLSIIWVEEASEVDYAVIAFLKARLRHKVGFYKGENRLKFLLSSNPDVGWLNTEWLMASSEIYYHGNVQDRYHVPVEKRDPDTVTHISATSSNIYLPPDYEAKLSRNKEQWWINRYLKGSFKYAEGLVYPEFDKWFVEPFDIPQHWKRITGTDFGRRDPTAHVIGALDPVKRIIYVYNEFEETLDDKPAEAVIKKIKKANSYPSYLLAYPHQADPRGRNKDQTSGKSWFDVYRERGMYLQPAEGCEANSIAPTIQKVAEYASAGRLKIFKSCVKMYASLSKYKYPERKLGDDRNQGETPQDRNNHLPDALRYMLAPFPNFPASEYEFIEIWRKVLTKTMQYDPLMSEFGTSADNAPEMVYDFMDNFG